MAYNVIRIESHDNFKGVRGSIKEDSGIIEQEKRIIDRNLDSSMDSQSDKGVSTMEITPKEYTDQRIEALEKSIDQRFDSNEKLISEKLDHLHTKFEGTLETKLNALKESISAEQKAQTQNNKANMIGIVSIATAIIIGGVSVAVTLLT